MADLDRLTIEIEASAQQAMPALDEVINKLTDLNNALKGVGNAGKAFQKSMTGLSNTSATVGRAVGSGFGKALTKGIEGSIGNAFKGVKSIITNISKMAVVGIPSLGVKGFQLAGSGFQLLGKGMLTVGKGALSAVTGIKNFATSLRGAHSEAKSLTSILAGLYIKIWGLKKVGSFLAGIATKATDFIESYHYFETAFQKIGQDATGNWAQAGYDSAEAYAQSFQDRALELTEKMSGYAIDSQGNATLTGNKSLGLDPEMLMNYQAQYGQMANGLGLVSESALNASEALTMLGADWSSLRNISFESSYEKMASALAGQSRAVRSLGIDITQATLQQYAYAAGIRANVSEMSQAAKTELRLIAILDQSRVAWGDMAKTLNTPANQMRLLQQNMVSLARTIGGILMPILAKVLPYINGVVIALQRLFAWLAKILGINVGEIATGMGGMGDEMEDFGDSLVEGIDDAEDDAEDLLDDLKEAKKTILGFDELNVLNAPYSDTKKDTKKDDDKDKWNPADMGKLDALLDSLLDEYKKKWNEAFAAMTNKAQEIADAIINAFKSKDWYGLGKLMASGVEWALQQIYDFLDPEKIYPKIKEVTDAVTTVINSFVENFPAELFGRTLGRMLNTYVYTMNQLYDGIKWPEIGHQLAVAFLGLLDEVDPYELGRLMTQKFRAAVEILVGFLETMHDHWYEVGLALGRMINGALSNLNPYEIGYVLGELFNAALTILLYTITSLDWIGMGRAVGEGLLTAVNIVDPNLIGETLSVAMNSILDFLGTAVNTFLVGGGFERVGEDIAAGLNGVLADPVKWGKLGDLIHDLLIGALQILRKVRENFRWEDVSEAVHDSIKSAMESEVWEEAFEELINWVKDICTFLIGILPTEEEWKAFGTKIHDLIIKVINDEELWKEAFGVLIKFVEGICAFLISALPTKEEWEEFGRKVGYWLGQIDWLRVFLTLKTVIINAVSGVWEGLGQTFAGRIVQGIIIYKLATFVLGPIVAQIGHQLVTTAATKITAHIASMLGISLNQGATVAAGNVAANGGLTLFAGSIASTLGSAAVIIGVSAAFLEACKTIGQGIELLQGGNGMWTEGGNAIDGLIKSVQDLHKITPQQSEDIWKMKEDMESAGASEQEIVQAVMDKFNEYGISLETVQTALGIMEQKGYATDSMLGILTDSTTDLKTETDIATSGVKDLNAALTFSDDGTVWSYEDIADSVWKLAGNAGITTENVQALDAQMSAQNGTITSLQGWYDALIEKCEELGIPIDAVAEQFGLDFPEALSTASTAAEAASTSISQSTSDLSTKVASDAEAMETAWKNGAKGATTDSVDAYEDAKKRIGTATEQTASKVEEEADKAAEGAKTKTTQGLNDVVGSINDKTGDFENAGKTVGEAAGTGTSTGITDKKKDVSDSADSVVNAAKDSASTATSVFSVVGSSAMEAMKLGFADKRDSVKDNLNAQLVIIKNNVDTSIFTSVGEDIVGKIGEGINNSSLYSAGQALMNTLQNGMDSISLSLPHVGWNWQRVDYGPDDNRQWFEVPNLFVNWYARGGLATTPTLAGIGEAGDEAVLPLTNKRAMSRIANAITSSGGMNGLDREDMIEAVATGVAMAMAQNPQTVEVVVNSTLRTDDERLAQAVSRGNARLNQRYNYG